MRFGLLRLTSGCLTIMREAKRMSMLCTSNAKRALHGSIVLTHNIAVCGVRARRSRCPLAWFSGEGSEVLI